MRRRGDAPERVEPLASRQETGGGEDAQADGGADAGTRDVHFRKVAEESGSLFWGDASTKGKKWRRHTNRESRANAWGLVADSARRKTEEHGGTFAKVKEANTTQTCSVCGRLSIETRGRKVGLGEVEWTCGCGARLNRKGNAAANIRRQGLASARSAT